MRPRNSFFWVSESIFWGDEIDRKNNMGFAKVIVLFAKNDRL